MALGVEGMPAGRVVRKAVMLVGGTALLAACLTVTFLAMRSVMDVGGACASGGAYEVAVECPDGVWLMPVGIVVGLGACVLVVAGSFRGAGPQPIVFAWPALFLSLGWNFWEYGLDPPDSSTGVAWGWIVCGVVFVLMGGLPLLAVLRHLRAVLWGGERPPAVPAVASAPVRRLGTSITHRRERAGPSLGRPAIPVDRPPAPAGPAADVVERLERLAVLHREGAIDDDEYEAAKDAVLGRGGTP